MISQQAVVTALSEEAAALMKRAAKEKETEKANELLAAALDRLQQAIKIADRGEQ